MSKIRWIAGAAFLGLIVSGCVSPYHQAKLPTWKLNPQLPSDSPVVVYVKDERPSVEIEKERTTEYLYSGSLFAVDGNTRTIAQAISGLVLRYGGASSCLPTNAIPKQGLAISFTLQHWYAKTLIWPEKGPLFVTGSFDGSLELVRNGSFLASTPIHADGTTSVVDMTIIFEREKKQTPKLIWDAMLNTANSAEQAGYLEIMNSLEKNWHMFSKPKQ